MANKQDYKLMLQRVLEVIVRGSDEDLFIENENEGIIFQAKELLSNDHTTYEWVIEYDGDVDRFRSEEDLRKFIKEYFEEDPRLPNQVKRIYKVEVDEDGNDIKNEIDLNLSWSFTID